MYYPVELDKTRNLRYGMKAISLLEKKFKKPIASLNIENLSMEDLATFVWAGLQHEDRTLTSDKVMDLIDYYSTIPKISKAMTEAFKLAFDGEKDENSEELEKNA